MPPQTLIAPYTNLPKLKLEKLPNGTNIAYRCLPPIPNRTLPTLFLIHPLLTDSTFFAPQFSDPALGRGTIWNLIAVDVHGHGYTSGRSNFDYWDMAEDVGLLMDAFRIPFATFLGTCQGGFVSLRLAVQRPTLVESIVLAGSPLLRETPDTKAMVLTLLHGFPYVPWKLQLALHVCFGQGDVAVIQRWGDVWKDRYGGSAGKEEIFRKCVEQFSERDDVGGRLAEMGEAMRVHVLHGELDPIYTAGEYAEGAREALEKEGKLGSYLVVEGALHYLSWGCWADVNKKLVEVMKKEVKEAKELEQEEEQAGVEEGVIDV